MNDELSRLQIRLRLVRFRLEGLPPDGAEWRTVTLELAALELEAARRVSEPGVVRPDIEQPGGRD
jgi:hypothetical protein